MKPHVIYWLKCEVKEMLEYSVSVDFQYSNYCLYSGKGSMFLLILLLLLIIISMLFLWNKHYWCHFNLELFVD